MGGEDLRKAVRSGESYSWDGVEMNMANFAAEVAAGDYHADTIADEQVKKEEEKGQEQGEPVKADGDLGEENDDRNDDDDAPLRQSHSREFFLGFKNDQRSRSQQSSGCSVGVCAGDGGSLESAGEQGDDVNFCASSPDSESVPETNHDDHAGMRGRRIIETEGAVKNMRRHLSAMGYLESTAVAVSGDAAPAVVEGGRRVRENRETDRTNADNASVTETAVPAKNRPNSEASEMQNIGGQSHFNTDSTAADRSGVSKGGGTSVAERETRATTTAKNLFSIETERDTAGKHAIPVSGCTDLTGPTIAYSPFKRPTPGGKPRQSAIIIPATTRDTGVSPAAGEPGERLRIWNRQLGKVTDQRSAEAVTPAAGALPRPDEEYGTALLRLSAAAEHAAQLYRELTQVAAAAATTGRPPSSRSVSAVSTDETGRAVVGTNSFELTGASAVAAAAGG